MMKGSSGTLWMRWLLALILSLTSAAMGSAAALAEAPI